MNDILPALTAPQPNVYGPVTPGQMFERASRLLRENFKLFFGIVLVLVGVEIIVGGILGGSGLWMGRSMVAAPAIARALVILPVVLVGAVLLFILLQIIQGALFVATQAKLVNGRMTVGEACKLAADKAGRLIGISLLVGLRSVGYMILFYLGLAALAAIVALMFGGFAHVAGAMPFRAGHLPSLGLGLFFAVFFLALLVFYLLALLWLIARYALSIPAALAENLSVTESIRRSIHLSSGSRGRLYALFLGIFCVYIVVAAVTLPVQFMVTHAVDAHLGVSRTLIGIVVMLLAVFRILISAVIVGFIGIAKALCYYDLRVRKEGFGVAVPSAQPQPPEAGWPTMPAEPTGDFPAS